MRKTKKLKDELISAAQRLEEVKRLEAEARAEEESILAEARKQIEAVCEKHGLFCGMILTPQDLGNVVAMAAASPDKQTHIPFNLYFKE